MVRPLGAATGVQVDPTGQNLATKGHGSAGVDSGARQLSLAPVIAVAAVLCLAADSKHLEHPPIPVKNTTVVDNDVALNRVLDPDDIHFSGEMLRAILSVLRLRESGHRPVLSADERAVENFGLVVNRVNIPDNSSHFFVLFSPVVRMDSKNSDPAWLRRRGFLYKVRKRDFVVIEYRQDE